MGLEAPHVEQAAALDLFPHEHQVVGVHALLEVLGRIDDVGAGHLLPQIGHEGRDQSDGRPGLAGDRTDNRAIEHDRLAGGLGRVHAAYDLLGLDRDLGLGKRPRPGGPRLEIQPEHAALVAMKRRDIPGKLLRGVD